jgi:hypothetical protein
MVCIGSPLGFSDAVTSRGRCGNSDAAYYCHGGNIVNVARCGMHCEHDFCFSPLIGFRRVGSGFASRLAASMSTGVRHPE